jgi:hypothetical protein
VAPLATFNSSAVPTGAKRHKLMILQRLTPRDEQHDVLRGLRFVAHIRRNLQNFCAAQYQRTIVKRGGHARLLRQDARYPAMSAGSNAGSNNAPMSVT